ncbi:MAG: MgtC/SapB family protein [Steroidobacteraceae bacterium]
MEEQLIIRLAAALAVGLLIGIERERSKGQGPRRAAAGVRTFTLIALAGAMSLELGGLPAFLLVTAIVGAFAAISYLRSVRRDPGLTTEVAMVVTLLLGGLTLREPQLAAALAVVVTIILASRTKVHDWIKNVLTDDEVRDGLLLAAAALVVLPLLPKQAVDPWGVVDLRKLWMLAVLVMAINGLGYIAVRALGAKVGLALAGLFSGFVSSTATIGAMGSRSKARPELHRSAVAGAAASSIATVVQLAIVVGLVSMPTLEALLPSLVLSGLAATAYAGLFTLRSVRETAQQDLPAGRPFSPKTALLFVLVVGAALAVSTALTSWLGNNGLLLASGVAGLGDAHAAAISAASLAAGGKADVPLAAVAVLIGFSTNSLSKAVVAFSLGDRRFALQLLPGLVLMVLAAWGGWFVRSLLA